MPISKNILWKFAIILLATLSLFPRIINIITGNYIFLVDQGRDYIAAKHIVVDHVVPLVGPVIGLNNQGLIQIYQGPGYFYILSVFFWLFRGNPYGGMVLMVLCGLSSIFVSYLIGKRLFGPRYGLILAYLLAISPPIIEQSQYIWNPNPATLFILLTLFAITYIPAHGSRAIFFAALCSGMIYNFEISAALPLCIATAMYVFATKKQNFLLTTGALIAGFFIAFLPMIMFEIGNKFTGIRQALMYISDSPGSVFSIFGQTLYGHFHDFLEIMNHTFPTHILSGTFPILIVATLFITLLRSENNTNLKRYFIYTGLIPVICFITFIPLRGAILEHYIIELHIAYIFITAYCLVRLLKNKRLLICGFAYILICVIVIQALFNGYMITTQEIRRNNDASTIKEKIKAIEYVYQRADRTQSGLLIDSFPNYSYPYDYLSWWIGNKTYNYVLPAELKHTLFLLIDTNASPQSNMTWLTMVTQDRILKQTATLSSGLIIQEWVLAQPATN